MADAEGLSVESDGPSTPILAPTVTPLTDIKLLEDYLTKICTVLLDLGKHDFSLAELFLFAHNFAEKESLASFEAHLAEPSTKQKLKAFATEQRAPVLVVTKRALDGALEIGSYSIVLLI